MIQSLIFFPVKEFYETPQDHGLQAEDVWLKAADGTRLFGWFFPASSSPLDSKPALLFLHGNAGNISGRIFKARGWVERGFSVLLIDYRTYGKSEGKIESGRQIIEDSNAALQWLIKEKGYSLERIILYGESLGSHPAVRLASENKAAALILESPFTSFSDLAKIHYGWIPAFMLSTLLKDFEFSNIDSISNIRSPLFILHGTRDETCPYEMSLSLMKNAPEPKHLMTVQDGLHNDLPSRAGERYWDEPLKFVTAYIA